MATEEESSSNSKKEESEVEATTSTITTTHRLKAEACPIDFVTVYNDRAEVTRRVSLQIDGTAEMIVYDLSPEIIADSIRVSGGEGNATVVEVSHREVYGDKGDDNQTNVLLRRLEELKTTRDHLNHLLERTKKERVLLDRLTQSIVKGSEQALLSTNEGVGELLQGTSKYLAYYSSQLARLDEDDTKTKDKLKDVDHQVEVTTKEIASFSQSHLSSLKREIFVSVFTTHSNKVTLYLSYLIQNASWAPSYDVRMDSASDTLQLIYYGIIKNSSGEDWTDVKLALSTASPSIGGAPPPLKSTRVTLVTHYSMATSNPIYNSHNLSENPLYNDQRSEGLRQLDEKADQLRSQAQQFKKGRFRSSSMNERKESVALLTTTAESSQVGVANSTYEISRRSTIVSDSKPHKVTIAVIDLKATLTHYASPDVSTNVYLKATAVNTTEHYSFLAGPMNIFVDSNFTATSVMKVVSPKEKFSVFLGVDSGVRLEVKPIQKFKERQTGIIYKSQSESFQHSSVVKNTRKTEVNLTVLVQIPISNDERVKVKLTKPDTKEINNSSDIKFMDNKVLKWKLVVAPNHAEEVSYGYFVEWPLNQDVVFTAN